MFVGHGVLAFAIVAWLALARDRPGREALALGLLAAAFGTLPDVDMLYAPLGLVGATGSITGASAAFWDAAHEVHRAATHSLVVGAIATGIVAAWQRERAARAGAAVLGAFLVAVAWRTGGPVGAVIMLVFVAGAIGLAALARRRRLPPAWIAGAAAVGLLTHPFGDLLTGAPPALLYPFDVPLLEGRVVLAADPTVNLLLAFFVELATLWLGLLVVARLQGWRLRWRVQPRAALGAGYAGVLVAVPAPTIDAAAPFVVSVLAVGLVGATVAVDGREARRWQAVATALAAVTVAGVAYLLAYLLVG